MADTDPATVPTAASGDAATGAAPQSGTPTAGANAGNEPTTVTLTQAELDAIIANRTAQARRVAAENADKAKKYDESLAAQQTESEKVQAKIDAANKAADDRLAAANAKLIAADIRVKATTAGIRSEALDLVVEHLLKADGVTVTDTGEVEGIEAPLAAFVKANDYLLTPKQAPTPRAGGAATGMSGASPAPGRDEQIGEALKKRDLRTAIGLKLQPKA